MVEAGGDIPASKPGVVRSLQRADGRALVHPVASCGVEGQVVELPQLIEGDL